MGCFKKSSTLLGLIFIVISADAFSADGKHLLRIESPPDHSELLVRLDSNSEPVSIEINGAVVKMAKLQAGARLEGSDKVGVDIPIEGKPAHILALSSSTKKADGSYDIVINYAMNYKKSFPVTLTKKSGEWILKRSNSQSELSCLFIGRKGLGMAIQECENPVASVSHFKDSTNRSVAFERSPSVMGEKRTSKILPSDGATFGPGFMGSPDNGVARPGLKREMSEAS